MKGSARKILILVQFAVTTVVFSGCVSLQSASLTQVPAKRDHKITADTSRYIFFSFNFDNDYVDNVRNELIAKCPNGKVTGILTKDEAVIYFPLVLHARRIHAEGYCDNTAKS